VSLQNIPSRVAKRKAEHCKTKNKTPKDKRIIIYETDYEVFVSRS
jgi:hypothetical protein